MVSLRLNVGPIGVGAFGCVPPLFAVFVTVTEIVSSDDTRYFYYNAVQMNDNYHVQ